MTISIFFSQTHTYSFFATAFVSFHNDLKSLAYWWS